MKKLRCATCSGSGKVMGGGMIFYDCEECDGKGKIYIKEESYEQAKEKIKALDETLTDEKAKNILDEELRKTTHGKKQSRRD